MNTLRRDDVILRPAIEYAVVDHCNLSCARCDHGSPHLSKRLSSLDEFEYSIKKLADVMHVSKLKLLGGEPLLHPHLARFVQIAKTSGIANEVELWSNGLLLHRAAPEVFTDLDSLVVTRYPNVVLALSNDEIKVMSAKYNMKVELRNVSEFMDAFVADECSDPSASQRIFDACLNKGEWSCHSVSNGFYYKCSRAAYIRYHISRSPDSEVWADDGVAIAGEDLKDRLIEYLRRPVPLMACRWCLGTSGAKFPHRQLPRTPRKKGNKGYVSG